MLKNLKTRLRETGLFVRGDDSTILVGVQRRDQGFDNNSISTVRYNRIVQIRRWEFENEVVYLEDETYVESVNKQWSFRNTLLPFVGEPNLDSVQVSLDNLPAVYDVVQNYYFGELVTIVGWQIPSYQHPTWDEREIRRSIESARTLRFPEFEKFRLAELTRTKERPARVVGNLIHGTMDDLLFYCIKGDEGSLYLRYDCKEAFIVPNPSDEEVRLVADTILKELRTAN